MDTALIRELLDRRDDLDRQIAAAIHAPDGDRGGGKQRKAQKCSLCGSEEHTARNCPIKHSPPPLP